MLSAIDLHKVLLQSQDTIPSFSVPEKSLRPQYNQFDFDQLETKRIFHRDTIKKTCIDYRLRFLNLDYFKGDVPVEAIESMQALEQAHNTELKNMKIIIK